MGNPITRKTWDAAENEETKLNILFDLLCETNNRVKALEKRKRVDSLYSFVGGILGGVGAIVAKMSIWRPGS